jgi:hypothetical protein
VTPFVIDVAAHALPGPDRLTSFTYAADLAYTKAIGGAESSLRTAEQERIAPFFTPPLPDYPSTHTVLGAAAAEVLIAFFGDRYAFRATSTTLPGVTRRFRGFSAAAIENGSHVSTVGFTSFVRWWTAIAMGRASDGSRRGS